MLSLLDWMVERSGFKDEKHIIEVKACYVVFLLEKHSSLLLGKGAGHDIPGDGGLRFQQSGNLRKKLILIIIASIDVR